MSILIKGMEMPKKENVIILINPYGGVWMIGDTPNEDTRLTKVKAVPIPPHGRLIDADAEISVNIVMAGGKCNASLFAPVIIPAEEGET